MGSLMSVAKTGKTTKRAAAGTPRSIPAEEGIALVDGNFRLIAISNAAEAILYTIGGSSGESNGKASLSPNLLNRLNDARSELKPAPIFLTAHGREYSCRAFELTAWSDDITPPVLALHFKQERSVVETVFQVGEEYHLTDREQEALIGVAMGLSSKELAVRMNISPHTVKAFLRLVMIKMGSSTRAGIVGKLIDKGGQVAVRTTARE
jgi:DNA-binding CsgD family transcriptional regulator